MGSLRFHGAAAVVLGVEAAVISPIPLREFFHSYGSLMWELYEKKWEKEGGG